MRCTVVFVLLYCSNYFMRSVLPILLVFLCYSASAQNIAVAAGDDVELPNREKFVTVVHADATGAYVFEEHYKHVNYLFKNDMEQTLYKLDNNCKIIFEKKLEHEIGSLWYLSNAFYGFNAQYLGKEKKYMVEISQLSPKDGSFISTPTKLFSIDFLSKDDNFTKNTSVLPDSSGFFIQVNQYAEKYNKLHAFTINKKGEQTSYVTIDLGDGDDRVVLDDTYVYDNRLVVVTRIYDYTNEKRKKKFLKGFAVTQYTAAGKMINQSFVEVKEKFINAAKFFTPADNKMIVAGFYSNDISTEYTNGSFTAVVDLATNTVTNTSTKEISRQILGYAKEGEKKAGQGMSGMYTIKKLVNNPATHGYIVVTENEWSSDFSSTSAYNHDLSKGFYGTTTTSLFLNRSEDILLLGLDKSGNIDWLTNVTKSQEERFRGSSPGGTDFPFFSSFVILPSSKALHLLFNDHPKNEQVIGTTNDSKKEDDFEDSKLYLLSVDYKTGKLTRKVVDQVSNGEYILLPKRYKTVGNVLFIASGKKRVLGKGGFRIHKIVID
jgi:hypothetical protein